MNFQNSKTCDSYRILLNLSGNLKNSDNHVFYQMLVYITSGKISKFI